LSAVRDNLKDEFKLQGLLNTNSLFASFIHTIYSLPYVPVDDIIKAYEEVILLMFDCLKQSEDSQLKAHIGKIVDLLSYLERTWIGTEVARQDTRKPGLYRLEEWNQFAAAANGWQRTNNSSEGKTRYIVFITTTCARLHRPALSIFCLYHDGNLGPAL
jgi:hypothetical protein